MLVKAIIILFETVRIQLRNEYSSAIDFIPVKIIKLLTTIAYNGLSPLSVWVSEVDLELFYTSGN